LCRPLDNDFADFFLSPLTHQGIDRHHPTDGASSVSATSIDRLVTRLAPRTPKILFLNFHNASSAQQNISVCCLERNTWRGPTAFEDERALTFEEASKPCYIENVFHHTSVKSVAPKSIARVLPDVTVVLEPLSQ
jgi:hypothetical protein